MAKKGRKKKLVRKTCTECGRKRMKKFMTYEGRKWYCTGCWDSIKGADTEDTPPTKTRNNHFCDYSPTLPEPINCANKFDGVDTENVSRRMDRLLKLLRQSRGEKHCSYCGGRMVDKRGYLKCMGCGGFMRSDV